MKAIENQFVNVHKEIKYKSKLYIFNPLYKQIKKWKLFFIYKIDIYKILSLTKEVSLINKRNPSGIIIKFSNFSQ